MSDALMKAFQKKHTVLASRLNHIRSRISTGITPGLETKFIDDLQQLQLQITENFEDITKTCSENDIETFTSQYDYDMYAVKESMLALEQALPPYSPPQSTPAPASVSTDSGEIKLPALELPTFHGDETEWPTFAALFSDAIASYPNLSGPKKLHLLLKCVKGPARSTIASIIPTQISFQEAWDLLRQKYQNNRDIAYRLVYKLLDRTPVSSAAQVQTLVDTVREVKRALTIIGYPVTQESDTWLVPMILSRLDQQLQYQWEESKHCPATTIPDIEDLLGFLQTWSRKHMVNPSSLHHASHQNAPPTSQKPPYDQQRPKVQPTGKCFECNLPHAFFKCPILNKATMDDRWALIKKHKVCHICFSKLHRTEACKQQPCRKCGRKHSNLLHKDLVPQATHVANTTIDHNVALLSTAVIQVRDHLGLRVPVRVLVDSCATSSYLHPEILDKLNLPAKKIVASITTVSGAVTTEQSITDVFVESRNGKFVMPVPVMRLGQQQTIPTQPVQLDTSKFNGLFLADPDFHIPRPVFGILGADVWAKILRAQNKINGSTVAIDTHLGWMVTGQAPSTSPSTHHVSMMAISENISELNLQKFWEIEEVPKQKILTAQEQRTEELFQNTTTVLPNGRFQVQMPLKNEPPRLGESKTQAIIRQKSLEKRMAKDTNFATMYKNIIREYIELRHLVKVHNQVNQNFLPHHGVLSTSATHKLRIVFDASAKTSTGASLNSETLDCPKTQPDLFNTLTRFMTFPIALTADIQQMYRQVMLDPAQHHLQSIVWRFSPEEPLQVYNLTTVTWGTKAAPYLATRVLNKIAESAPPELADSILHGFYVDDLLTGHQTSERTIELQRNLEAALQEHGFPLHKWASNCPKVTKLPNLANTVVSWSQDTAQKTLGILWDSMADTFSFHIDVPQLKKLTRRSVLAQTNAIFDPLGFLAPITVRLKLFTQHLWKTTTSWDEPLSPEDQQTWRAILDDVNNSKTIVVSRNILPANCANSSLCGFSDASEKAYAAVVYLRTELNDNVIITLVAAKSKVAPMQRVTLPRLELCGAVLLSRLITAVQQSLPEPLPVTAWTDSTVTLGWLSAHPSKWKTFFSHRVQEVQNVIPPEHWRHINGTLNPADLPTRGISTGQLLSNSLWFNGPNFLRTPQYRDITPVASTNEEQRPMPHAVFATTHSVINIQIENFSSVQHAIRTYAYVLRFIHNAKCNKNQTHRVTGCLQHSELQRSETLIWKTVQMQALSQEYQTLHAGQSLLMTSRILPLAPFLDPDGLIRVGGRLRKSHLPYGLKHPILLPRHTVVDRFIMEQHKVHLHAGPSLLATILQRKYWIPNIISHLKRILHKCVRCVRAKATTAPSRPFTNTACDLFGPITLRTHLSRGTRHYKAWGVLFICMATRAIPLDLVTSLSRDGYVAALHRFMARRGMPNVIMSDNGTNFQATAKLLEQLQAPEATSQLGPKWVFIPSSAPHFGGLWEAGVKSMKYHLHRVVGDTPLTYEEMQTVLARIEACLNSRPLTALSTDPHDYRALTPAHFLILGELNTVPDPELPDKIPALRRWQLVEKLSQHFWKRWAAEYLTRLQQRPKWLKPRPNLAVGQLVLVKDELTSSLHWKLGRIVEIHKGDDGLARSATIKTALSTLERPVVKLCPLPLD